METTIKTEIPSRDKEADLMKGILSRLAQVGFVFLFQAIILFVGAGTLSWIWAWIFLAICVVSVMVNASFMLRTNPETIAERGRAKETKDWDLAGGR
jgi:hypothetical protein